MEESKESQNQTPRIVKLIIFARHGARHPIKIPENYKYYELSENNAGKLTKAGKKQLKWLGRHVKDGLVPQMIKKEKYNLYVRSTETQRTLNSTKNFLKGMMAFKIREVKKEFELASPSRRPKPSTESQFEVPDEEFEVDELDENAEYLNQLCKFIECHKVAPKYKGIAYNEIPYHKKSYDFERSGFVTHIEVLSKAHDKLLLQYKNPEVKDMIKKKVNKEERQKMILDQINKESEGLKKELEAIVGSPVGLGDIKVISTLFDWYFF